MILTVIQARMSSTRLPGKILLPIAGKSILEHVWDAAPEPKVVAMPNKKDGLKISHLRTIPVIWPPSFVDTDDVLTRFNHAWSTFKPEADWILRICCDCPMLTKGIVQRFIFKCGYRQWDTLYTNRPLDADGYDMELFSTTALEWAHKYATDPYDREHVTPWLYRHLNVRRFSIFERNPRPEDPAEKVSVDTREDYEKVKKIMEAK